MTEEKSAEAVLNTLAADIPIGLSRLTDMKNVALSVNQMIRNVINRLKNKELPMNEGMSFLDVKNQMLLKYLMNLSCFILKKCYGESVEGSTAIDRLVEIRTILERMRPVEHKLRYQIDKLIKIASSGKLTENDPLRFKANPGNLFNKMDNSDDTSEEEMAEKQSKKNGAYMPPKLAATPYDEDETIGQHESKEKEKVRRHLMSSSVLQGLREEFLDTPAEIVESNANSNRMKQAKERKEIQEYEETYFTRLPVTRQDRHRSRQMNSAKLIADELVGLSTFGDKSSKKRKSLGGKKKKGGFSKKRKH